VFEIAPSSGWVFPSGSFALGDLPARNARRRVAEGRPPDARAGTSEGHARRSFIRRNLSLGHTISSLVRAISSLIRPYPSLVRRRPSKERSRRSEGWRRLSDGTRRPSKGRSRRSEGWRHPCDGTRRLRDEIRRPCAGIRRSIGEIRRRPREVHRTNDGAYRLGRRSRRSIRPSHVPFKGLLF